VISHVVLFRTKPDLAKADRDALVASFTHAVQDIPDVRGVRAGRRVIHGAGYEQTTPDVADLLIVIDFDDLVGLQAYLRHPAHIELGARFKEASASGLVYDFEVGNDLEVQLGDGHVSPGPLDRRLGNRIDPA
jgi:hypothetical protein